ncbi:MAG: 50S ribosomal protein L35 [Armatimonadetes bacterium]|nr:50S ribosomal protein L35 [Armatimonadota bacterium]
MPKLKTNKSAAKRFKKTSTGKLMRRHAYDSHLFLHKSGSRKRRLAREGEVFKGELKRMYRLMGGKK